VTEKVSSLKITVYGQVQGIGFRPFIYRTAIKLGLKGYVKNTKNGVVIVCQGNRKKELLETLKFSPPPLSIITKITTKQLMLKPFNEFQIEKSEAHSLPREVIQIPPDLSICKDCTKDLLTKTNRRYFYPFTNCTQCGPRYSIIQDLPYDRPNTTMNIFKMCNDCQSEYENPKNRRFHAQPNACPKCGPKLILLDNTGKQVIKDNNQKIIGYVQRLLKNGKIIAIKSIGGFQIACDAKNPKAILTLRKRKNRPKKPFALMCKDIRVARKLAYISKEEAKLLKSSEAPIVLLQKKARNFISEYISPQNGYLGIMLPYTPLHKLLFVPIASYSSINKKLFNVSRETLKIPDTLIMTSANPKSQPILSNSKEVVAKLGNIVDYILDHEREIYSRCDDSIVFVPKLRGIHTPNKYPVIVRYSRGYVPRPIYLAGLDLVPTLAFGGDLKNYFALGVKDRVYLSPYIGDLISNENVSFFFEMLEKYERWFNIKPEIVVCDLHPNYISVRLAEEFQKSRQVKLIKVQHHYAHLLSVYTEYNLKDSAIGIAFDGTGYGEDGAIWGSEIMVFDDHGYERLAHLTYMPLVGGDNAVTNPEFIKNVYWDVINNRIKLTSGTVMTSSMGRLFDAVSAFLGLCKTQTFEAEAPIALENAALEGMKTFSLAVKLPEDPNSYFDCKTIIKDLLALKENGLPTTTLALWFHKRIVKETVEIIKNISAKKRIKQICVAGGVFQNRMLLTEISKELNRLKFKVYLPRIVPINDGGLALGQITFGRKTKKY
jgi:hydrogenase maturation protein HypF